MSAEESAQNIFNRLTEEQLAVYTHLAQSMDDIKLGRVQNADDVFDDVISELDRLDI